MDVCIKHYEKKKKDKNDFNTKNSCCETCLYTQSLGQSPIKKSDYYTGLSKS